MVLPRLLAAIAGLSMAVAESVVLLAPEASSDGTPIAVVWIQGANYNAGQYTQIAQAFQLEAASAGYKAWVGIPDFTFKKPNPKTIDKHIASVMDKINDNGFTGDNWFLAAHSLGGVMTQSFLTSNSTKADPSLFKGQVLMSSVLLRDTRSVQKTDGTTLYDYETPTLTMGGTKDGLMRITRVAESYWHQVTNIDPSQADLFPVDVLEGVAHYQFAGGVPPTFVQENDLMGDISDADARDLVGQSMTKFIDDILTNGVSSTSKATDSYMTPFVNAMTQEGSSIMKEPCYQSEIINVPTPDCLKGSPWVEERALKSLVGDLSDPQVTLVNSDNFHRASTVYPYHHPQLSSDCDDHSGPCEIDHISVTQNIYSKLNELDLGKTPIAATSMRVKLKSSTSVHVAAREPDADFDTLDRKLTECQTMNEEIFDWAYTQAGKTAQDLYTNLGEKLIEQPDKEQPNGGLWIIQELEWNEAKDKSEMDNVSVALILPEDELVPIFKSMHYCKMLSPFRALEWIYVDSQYAFGGYQAQTSQMHEMKFLSE